MNCLAKLVLYFLSSLLFHYYHLPSLSVLLQKPPKQSKRFLCVCAKSFQLCPTLCDITDCSLPGSSVHGNSPGENTGVDCHALPQGIFPTQESNLGLPYCRQILYCLSYQGSPTGVGSLSLLQGIFPTQESNMGLRYQLNYQRGVR